MALLSIFRKKKHAANKSSQKPPVPPKTNPTQTGQQRPPQGTPKVIQTESTSTASVATPGTFSASNDASYPSLVDDYAASSVSSQSDARRSTLKVRSDDRPERTVRYESPRYESPRFAVDSPITKSSSFGTDSSRSRLTVDPPRLNTDLSALSPGPSSPLSRNSASSPTRMPGSFIRHSRVLSASSTIAGGLNHMFTPSQSLHIRQRTIITDLPSALSPVVNLANAQRLRPYASGRISILAADNVTWHDADASLTGTELSIWVDGSTKPRYVNVQDCTVVPSETPVPGDGSEHEIVILQDFESHHATLHFSDREDMLMWLAAFHLCKYEQNALSEAFTAVILSLRGPELSDIYTLLAHKKRFPRFEWCNVRLPQISNKWLKVFMAIIPGESKKLGRVEMYTSEKINKKNLILYVNAANSVYNVYPEDHHMIELNSIMKIEGEVFVNKHFESMFSHDPSALDSPTGSKHKSRPSSITSLSSLNPPAGPVAQTRSRSTSVNSTSSFFNNAPSPTPESGSSAPGSPKRSTRFFKKQSASDFVTTNYMYLMPEAHPSVSQLEIMLRNFVHIIDAFKLYGRPDSLDSDKTSKQSMLFGLPALPHFGYLDVEDAYKVISANYDNSQSESWGDLEWRNCFKDFLHFKQQDGQFRGVGNIYELFSSFETDGSSEVFSEAASPVLSRVQSPTQPMAQSKLRRPFDFEGESPEKEESESLGGLGRPFEVRRDGSGRGHGRSASGLHPIADMPTPIDDAPFYFNRENQVPLRM